MRVWDEMKKSVIRVFGLVAFANAVLTTCSAFAATGSSPEFRLDLRGLGPWQRHVARASEPLAYSSAWVTNAAAGAKAVVKVMPVLKTKPKYLVIDLSGGTSATHYPISYLDEVPGGSWSDEYKTSKLVLRHIPAGSFIMGGRATDYPGAVNTNLHMVTITRDFYMGVFEVTQRQWELVMGKTQFSWTNKTCAATRPMDRADYETIRGSIHGPTWPESIGVESDSFIGVLRRKSKIGGWDIPTQAQWEYACRAGTSTALASGRNLTSNNAKCRNADEVARYQYNSGMNDSAYMTFYEQHSNEDVAYGTAKVGSYLPNQLGLFDMHGNVYEYCLDVWSDSAEQSIDPVGPSSCQNDTRTLRGGSWAAWGDIRSGKNYSWNGHGALTYNVSGTTGFRLCLQGGDVPDFAAAATLVNESGSGSQSWTPTRAGAYYLTHSTMNGATNAQLMSAWFEVPGCELALEPQGELTNGVSVAITGAGEGWTVYYTTNGLAPSKASEKYTGPFSLPESATVRAVAYNAQGVTSDEATTSFTLHDALSVVGAVARPRYPWNGMVDVDCEIKGDPEAEYDVELVVKDLEGGTNLPVRTVYVDAIGTIASTLAPGRHRLTWNADADIAYDHDFPRVAVTVKATKQSVLAGYARQFAISTDGYTGEETLTGVPVLVRLSTAIDGFDYRDFASPSNGADLAFFDANEQALPYEIDEWHTNGESLVWVKLAELKKGTRFTCAYGNPQHLNTSTSQLSRQHEVWREYAGVWHMNEDSGTAFDSTEHGLDALPSCGTNKLTDISQMVAYENGACGRARVNSPKKIRSGNFMTIPSYDALGLGGEFVFSGWFSGEGYKIGETTSRIVSRKATAYGEGWEVCCYSYEYSPGVKSGSITGSYNNKIVRFVSDMSDAWVGYSISYRGGIVQVYTNGVLATIGSVDAAADNGLELSLGIGWEARGPSFYGQYDEIRLRGGSLSADRIKADYAMIANRAFCTYGTVKEGAK